MRSVITFACEGALCAATLDAAPSTTGLLIVSGGNEIRIGSHQGMARLAQELREAGFPVLRYDRRGVGDSEGSNGGFDTCGPDIAAALAAFRGAQPQLQRIVALGNCDGATALLLHRPAGLAELVLTNPWVVEVVVDTPAPAATRAYYAERLRNPRAWLNLLRGRVNMLKAAESLSSAVAHHGTEDLAKRVAAAISECSIPVTILLADHDGTAIAFLDQWSNEAFDAARRCAALVHIDSPSHSFAASRDHAQMRDHILATLTRVREDAKL